MAISITQVINDACLRYRDLTRAQALLDLQSVHDELIEFMDLTDDTQDIALVSSQPTYAIPTTILDIREVGLMFNDISGCELEQVAAKSVSGGFRMNAGTPRRVYRKATLTGGRVLGVDPAPSYSSLLVAGGTATTPIVI